MGNVQTEPTTGHTCTLSFYSSKNSMVKIHTEKHNTEKMFLGNVCNSNIKELCDQYSAYDVSLAGTKFIS